MPFRVSLSIWGRGEVREETGMNTDNKNWRVASTDSRAAFSLGQLTTLITLFQVPALCTGNSIYIGSSIANRYPRAYV